MPKKRAFIAGIAGQDGAYLADFLLKKDYEVTGLVLPVEKKQMWRLDYFGIQQKLKIISGDITNESVLRDIIKEYKPDEVYNLAGISDVARSWDEPAKILWVNGLAVINLLDTINKVRPEVKLFQASSANIYGSAFTGNVITEKQNFFSPEDPYGVAKLVAHCSVRNYRRRHGLFCVNGVLFNHVSPLHGDYFVFKKIIKGVVEISCDKKDKIELGNLDAKRDWGFAGDYVEAMWLMLQRNKPNDYIICSGKQRSIKDLLKIVFQKMGIENWKKHVRVEKSLLRKKDILQPRASSEKIKKELNWRPRVSFEQLVQLMIDYEMEKSS